MRGLRDGLRRDLFGVLRAGAIVIGFICTVAGYVVGTIKLAFRGDVGQQMPREMTAHS
jgi:hypothetical protein